MAALTNPMIGLLAMPGLYTPVVFPLATDRVRFVGDPVALIVASSRYVAAEDAANLVEVEYDELAPVATMAHALDPARPAIWPGAGGNVLFRRSDEYADAAAALAAPTRSCARRSCSTGTEPADGDGAVRRRDRHRQRHDGVPRATQNSHVLKGRSASSPAGSRCGARCATCGNSANA
ncbi:MAG: hypothetical protein U0W40_19245 [Acidimicrobiia bacterium]